MFAYYKRQDNLCLPYMRDATRKERTALKSSEDDRDRKPQDGETSAPETDDMRRREQAARLSQEATRTANHGEQEKEQERERALAKTTNHLRANHRMPAISEDTEAPEPRLAKTKVRKTPTTRPQARRAKWFDPQVWWHSVGLATCLLLLICCSALTPTVNCEEQSAVANTGGGGEQPAQQQQIEVANSDKPTSGDSVSQAQISPDDTQQKVSEESLGAPASDASQEAKSSADAALAAAANNSEQSAETQQQAGADSSAAAATNSPAPSDLDSAAATATNLQQQATVQQQLEEVPASVPTPQDVAQEAQSQQQHQLEQVSSTSTDQQQQEQQTRATNSNYENDLLPVSQYGGDSSFGKKHHAGGDSSSQRARDSMSGATKSSRSLKRAFGGAHMGVFGRKRPNQLARHQQQQQQQQEQQEQLTMTQADNSNVNTHERLRPGKLKSQAHHHYYYQTVQQHQQEPQQSTSGGKQRQQLKQADYPDYKEILVQPDNLGGQEYEVQRHQQVAAVDVARSQPTTTGAPPAPEQPDPSSKFEQDKVSVGDSDGVATETSTPEQQATTTASSAQDHSGFEVQQLAQGGSASGGEAAPSTKDSQMPYIRLSNIATINSTTSTGGGNSSAAHATGSGEMKLMRIYVIDLDQKLVVGGSGGQNTYSPMASILDGAATAAATTQAPSKASAEQQQQQVPEQAVEQVKVDSDSLDQQQQQQHPYSENAAQLMQTQQSSTVYATTSVPTSAELDSTAPATESHLSPLSELAHHNYTSPSDIAGSAAGHDQPHTSGAGSNYTSPPHPQQVVVVSDDYQKYAQQMSGAASGGARQAHNSGEFVYVDRDSLQANLSQIMAQMAHNSYIGPVPPVLPQLAHSSVGHFYHYPNHMLMTMSHQQQQPGHNYSLVGGGQPAGPQYYASNHQQVNYGPPGPENLVYLNPSANNGTQAHYYTNHRNQYLGKSARAAEPPTATTTTQAAAANHSWSQPAMTSDQLQHYQLQSLSVAYPSFIQQQQQAAGGVGQFAAVYPAVAPMQHHQVQQQQQQPLVMAVPQYIAPQYAPVAAARPAQNYSTGPAHDTTTGHAMIVSQQQQQQPTVSIYKQQQQLVAAQDSGEQYSPPAPAEWQTTEGGHPGPASSAASSAYNTQLAQQVQLANNDTNYKQAVGGPDPADKYPPPANKSASHLYVYSQQQQQQPSALEYLMYQQAQQQQHPILANGGYAPAAGQTGEPGQQHYYAQAQAQAQAQVDPYGAGGKVTTQQQQQQAQSDHWKPVDSASPAAASHGVNFYPLKSGAGQQAAAGPAQPPPQSKSLLLNGYSGQPDHDIVSLSARQQQQQQQLMLSASGGYGALATANTSAPLDSEHAHLGANYPPPMAYANRAQAAAVELAPSQQVHAHPSFSSSQHPMAAQTYNGTGLGAQMSAQQSVEAYQVSSGAGQQQPPQQQQIGVTNEYGAGLAYTSKRHKQASEQTSEEAPKIPRAHSGLTPTATAAQTAAYRRPPSDTSGSYAHPQQQQEAEDQDDGAYEPAEPANAGHPTKAGAKGHAGAKYADGQKSPAAARPHNKAGGRPAKKQQVKVVKQSEEILQQYAEPDQLSLQQAAAHQQQVAGDLSGGGGGVAGQQELIYGGGGGQQQTRQPGGAPYMGGADSSPYVAPGAPAYGGNLMMRQPPLAHYRPQPAHQPAAPSKPGLLSWETISSVASGAAKRIPGALSSFLSPFKYQQHPVYPTANYGSAQQQQQHNHHQYAQYPKSAHYAGDVANFHRPYPLSHMSRPQTYSDSGPGQSHSGAHAVADPSEHQVADPGEDDAASGEQQEAGSDGETDLSGASSSSSAGEQSTGDSHTLNVTSHAHKSAAASPGLNVTEIVGDLAAISPDGRPPGAVKRRPIHGASTGSKSKGAGSKRPAGGAKASAPGELKELDPAQAAVLTSIEHELAGQQSHKPHGAMNKGSKRKPGGKKGRPPVPASTAAAADEDQTRTTPLVDPTILAGATHPGAPIHLDSLPLDQQRLLMGKIAGAHNGLASYLKQAALPGGAMFPSPEAAASALGSGPLPAHMMASGLSVPSGAGGGGGGPQLNALQIGQYKIVPQTQFVQSIIEPSRQMLGQYFRQYLGQLNQFAAG